MNVKFACTQLASSGKKGILVPDENGYYTMPIGGLNVFNSAGMYYTAVGAKELFEGSSQLMRRVKRGALRGEVGHPQKAPRQSDDEYLMRILTIDEKNVCAHFSELWLDFDNYKDTNGKPMIAIMGKVAPSGPFGGMLKASLDNPKENVCFSIRSLTEDVYKRGIWERTLRNVVTFDYVNEPGIHIAEKYKSTALEGFGVESLMEKPITRTQLSRAICSKGNSVAALESISLTPRELFTSLGWSLESDQPFSSKW